MCVYTIFSFLLPSVNFLTLNLLYGFVPCVFLYAQSYSNVYLASLDATKAFDRIHHIKLFNMLLELNFPGSIVNLLFNWYCKNYTMVRWNNNLSRVIHVCSGIRQGGILSPFLFNIYFNSIITALKASDLGCHIDGMFVGFIACIC